MFAKSMLLVPMLVLALAQPTVEEKAKKDLEIMQGIWVLQALEINGKEVAPAQIQDTILTVKKDEYKTKVKDKEPPGFRVKLDPSKNPKAIDMFQTQPDGTEKLIKGIYKIEKDVMKVCRGLTPEQERPTQFATWPNTSYFVVTWKKK